MTQPFQTFGPITPVYVYAATVERVLDGDTYVLRLDLGFRASVALNIRVRGYDAPELHGPDRAQGILARNTAESYLRSAKQIAVQTYKDEQSFARWIADVYVDGHSIGDLLTEAGYAKVLGGKAEAPRDQTVTPVAMSPIR